MKEEKISFEMPQIIDISIPESIGAGETTEPEPEQSGPDD